MKCLLSRTNSLIRQTTFCLLTLLLSCLCACDDAEQHTALRFVVFSDAKLSAVRVVVLDEMAMKEASVREFSLDSSASSRVGEPLLSIQVELNEQSKNRGQAVLRFEGLDSEHKSVLSQTVRANFADNETLIVRTWLSRSCANKAALECPPSMSCSIYTGKCEQQQALTGLPSSDADAAERWTPEDYTLCGARDDGGVSDRLCPTYCDRLDDDDCSRDPECGSELANCNTDVADCETDLRSSADHCGGCNMPCKYRRCEERTCTEPALAPTEGTFSAGDAASLSATYTRRVVKSARSIVALGGEFKGAGGMVQFFVATDEEQGPGKVLALGSRMVIAGTADETTDGFIRAEYVFDPPVAVSGAAFWIGARATSTLTRFARFGNNGFMEIYSPALPVLGERLSGVGQGAPSQLMDQSPYLYTRYFD